MYLYFQIWIVYSDKDCIFRHGLSDIDCIFRHGLSDTDMLFSDMDLDEEYQEEESIMEEETYDCVICNQTTTSTETRPVGLVTLLQPTSGELPSYSLPVVSYPPTAYQW